VYLQHFHLTRAPFHITPDPEFLYSSPSHREALASITYGIEERKGSLALIGEVGVGKTTILRTFTAKADREKLKIISLYNANMTFKNLVKTLCAEMDVPADTEDYFELVPKLYEALIEQYRLGRNVVMIIDEAQNMPIETLENLSMLSNLETTKDKLMQIVLCGQIELDYMLSLQQLRQLKQRIVLRAVISPLTPVECEEYIRHRLARAGCTRAIPFTKTALKEIVRHARGIPRILNILCDNALLTAFGYRKEKVDKNIVKEIIIDRGEKRRPAFHRWIMAGLLALLMTLLAASGYWFGSTKLPGMIRLGNYLPF
jgi:general secretion pathway protein A